MVRSKLILTKDNPWDSVAFEITDTYTMTIRAYEDRNPDMEINFETGARMTIRKEFVAGVLELKIVRTEEGDKKMFTKEEVKE